MSAAPAAPTRPRRAVLLAAALLASGLFFAAVPTRAQILHLDPMPWSSPADSTSRLALEVAADHFFDARYDWSVDRLLLTVILPGGDAGRFFVRMPHLTFDTGNVPVLQRWPGIRGEDMAADWPGSGRVNGFGQVEAGTMGDLSLPLLGEVAYGAALGLPVGSEDLYPFSSTSMPLRLELRKSSRVAGPLHLHLTAGTRASMGSGRAGLDEDAFTSGHHLGAELDWYRGRGSRLAWTLDSGNFDGRTSLLAGMQVWFPWTADGSVGLKAAKELEGDEDRPAQWYVTLAWRFDSPAYRPAPAAGKMPSTEPVAAEDQP